MSTWCYHDQLGGVDVVDGERMRLRWPDGHEDTHVVHVESRRSEGMRDSISHKQAYVMSRVHGVPAQVWLRDSGVLGERVTAAAEKEHGG